MAQEVLDAEWTVAQQIAAKRRRQQISIEALSLFLAAELIPAYALSTVKRLLSSVFPVGRANAACSRRADRVVACSPGASLLLLMRSNHFAASF